MDKRKKALLYLAEWTCKGRGRYFIRCPHSIMYEAFEGSTNIGYARIQRLAKMLGHNPKSNLYKK